MTKSIKEKVRLHKIKEHENLGTKVTPDLLKIRLVYESLSKRRRRIRLFRNRLVPPQITKSVFHDYFKNNINKLMVNIAANMKLYEFKVHIRVSNTRFLSSPVKKGISLHISISNYKNQHLGSLFFENSKMQVLRNPKDAKKKEDIKNMMEELLSTLDDNLKLTLNLNIHKSYYNESLNPRLKSLDNKIINSFISNFNIARDCYKNLQEEISIITENGLNTYRLEILINNEFYFRFSYEHGYGTEQTDIYKFTDYEHMLYFKTIIKSIYPNLEIPDEHYVESNIDEIKPLLKWLDTRINIDCID